MKRSINSIVIIGFILILSLESYSQDFSNKSIKVGAGIGIAGISNCGVIDPSSMLLLNEIRYQIAYCDDRLRIAPGVLVGNVTHQLTLDVNEMYGRTTSLGCDVYYDVVRYKSLFLFVGIGGFVNYSRGLEGDYYSESGRLYSADYFYKLFCGGDGCLGLRFAPTDRRLAWELNLNGAWGSRYFFLGYYSFGMDIKLGKRD